MHISSIDILNNQLNNFQTIVELSHWRSGEQAVSKGSELFVVWRKNHFHQSIPIKHFSLLLVPFQVPKGSHWVVRKIIVKLPLVRNKREEISPNWLEDCLPPKEGRRLGSLKQMNRAPLHKWLWRMEDNLKGLCEDILMTNYGIARQRWDMEMATKHLFDLELVCLPSKR